MCLAAALAVAEPAAARRQVAGASTATLTVWDGVYTEPQARRGLLAYTRSCERCHGSDLTGNATDEVPALVADAFAFHWRGRPVQDLYDRMRKSMPADEPGSLEAGVYLDIVAYLLEANRFPSGPQDLDRGRLRAVIVEENSSPQPVR
jgi:hypothetical protein